jgi:hypothetical protein
MAIIQLMTNSNPFVYEAGNATKLDGANLPNIPTTEGSDICLCDLGCEYIENVFGKSSGDYWESDKNDFLLQKLVAVDTITFKLYKEDVLVATISDNTYGTFYDFGDLNNALYTGFVIDWELVLVALGIGNYQVKADKVILGTASTFESQKFKLLTYTDYLADGTVRIESYQNGNIMSSQFDYTDILAGGWYQSFRIKGRLGSPSPKIKTDRILNEDYELVQVQDKITKEWELETEQLPAFLVDKLIYDNTLSNQFLVTDYNIYNHEIYRRVDLYATEIEKVNEPDRNRERSYKITLTDKLDNHIKRNY